MEKIKIKITALLMFFLFSSTTGKSQILEFVKKIEGIGTTSIATDKEGNYYTAGYLTDTAYMGNTMLVPVPSYQQIDVYIAKYNNQGEVQWAIQEGGKDVDILNDIGVDGEGNVYVSGYFFGYSFIDSTIIGGDTLTTLGEDGLIIKYNNDGVIQWVKQLNSPYAASAGMLALDSAGNIVVIAYYNTSLTIEGDTSFTEGGGNFIIKYTPEGKMLWAKTLDAALSISDIQVHAGSGDIYLAGRDRDSFTNNESDAIIIKMNADGNIVWEYESTHNPSPTESVFIDTYRLEVDRDGNAFALGYLSNNVIFGDSLFTAADSVFVNDFMIKLDSGGNLLLAKQLDPMELGATAIDSAGNIIIWGRPFENIFEGFSVNPKKPFLFVKYSNTGVLEWLKAYPGGFGDVDINNEGDIFFTGILDGGTYYFDNIVVNSNKVGSFSAKMTEHDFGVHSFTLINADTDQPIITINNNDTINLSLLPPHLNIKVNTSPDKIGSVRIVYDKKNLVEDIPPYAVFGDVKGDYNTGSILAGNHMLSAYSYAGPNATGTLGDSLTIRFIAINGTSNVITSFTLINAITDHDIRTISNNDTIDLAGLPSNSLNIRANTGPTGTKSVRLVYDGLPRIENVAPYSLFGDNSGNYNPGIITNGFHNLSATPYSGPSLTGTPGIGWSISFYVMNSSSFGFRKGMDAETSELILIYPNPATSYITISSQSKRLLTSVELLDSYGRIVRSIQEDEMNTDDDIVQLEIDRLAEGVYYLKCSSTDWNKIEKVIIKR